MHINGSTALVGLLADPISHVKTPQLFNASVRKQNLNVCCVPMHVQGDKLDSWLLGVPAMKNFLGAIVTIPYKERVVSICSELTDTAALVGSVNALRFDRERGIWCGGNFDGDGFVSGLARQGQSVTGKRVLQIGAGGAGKSVAYALAKQSPSELVIANRSLERAHELVERLKNSVPNTQISVGKADAEGFDVIVNTTSLGLQEHDEFPVRIEGLRPGVLVCEAVMRDGDTRLLAYARNRGCIVHHGQHMLYGQIVEMSQFLGVPLLAESVEYMPTP